MKKIIEIKHKYTENTIKEGNCYIQINKTIAKCEYVIADGTFHF